MKTSSSINSNQELAVYRKVLRAKLTPDVSEELKVLGYSSIPAAQFDAVLDAVTDSVSKCVFLDRDTFTCMIETAYCATLMRLPRIFLEDVSRGARYSFAS